jgi:hypothetical protein
MSRSIALRKTAMLCDVRLYTMLERLTNDPRSCFAKIFLNMWPERVVVNYSAIIMLTMLDILPVAIEIAFTAMLMVDTITVSFQADDLPFNSP